MTLWSPEYRIKANGTDVTGISLVGFTITKGRTDINSFSPPGYCRLDLINFENDDYPFTVNTSITIEVKKSNGTYVFLFGGRISDISTQVQSAGSSTNFTSISITALGLTSRLNRATYSGTLSEDLDGAQILDLLLAALTETWTSVPPSETWASYDNEDTWLNAAAGVGEVDTGLYTMRSQTLSSVYVGNVANDIAQSAGGFIYEDNQGRVCYADGDHRVAQLLGIGRWENVTNTLIWNNYDPLIAWEDVSTVGGYTDFDARQAYASGIASVTRQGDVVNKFTINHGNNFTSSHTSEDLESQANFGLYAQAFDSYMKNSADVSDFADRIISLRSYPFSRFASITFPIQSPEIDDADRDALLGIDASLPIRITNLPNNIQGGQFEGFVEGWTWRSTVNGLSLTLTASPTAFSAISQRWEQVNAAEQWNTISTAIEWEYAIGVIS